MHMQLVPLKVSIGLKPNGHHSYPDFNKLSGSVRENMDWSIFIDKYCSWCYDGEAGHVIDDPDNDSPIGIWLGMLLVPEPFANAAISKFPKQVRELTEAEAKQFYEGRVTKNQPDVNDDLEVLQGIKIRQDMGIINASDLANALDIDHPSPGRRRNKLKKWDGFKQSRGFEIAKGGKRKQK